MTAHLKAAACVALLAGCAGDAPPAVTPDFTVIEGGFSRGRGPDGNSYVYDGPDGLVVIDTGRHPGHSALILDEARARAKPVAAIVNTHWHLDHTTGNADIKEIYPEAKTYATRAIEGALAGFLARGAADGEKLLERADLTPADRAEIERGIATVRKPDALLPDVAVEGPMSLPDEGRTLELHVARRAVTEADIWIWDPATKTAIVGDLVTVPAPFFDTACPEGWRRALDDVSKRPFDRVAPGHGPVLDRASFTSWVTAFDNLRACAARGDEAGVCADGWTADAARFIGETERTLARDMIVYYVEAVLRAPDKIAAFCGT